MAKNVKVQEVSFDYDKLAEAIVKAEQKVKEEDNKIDEVSDILKILLTMVFFSVGITLLLVAFVCLIAILTNAVSLEGVQTKIGYGMIFVFSLCYGVISLHLYKKVKRINDKSYLLNYFSAVTGLLALIVSIIALVKG